MKNKICTRCGATKRLDMFPFAKDNKDGRLGYCKDCWNIDHREALRRFRLKDSTKEQHRIEQALYQQRHPERVKARWQAYNHNRRKSELLKSGCESCGAIDNLHMHHPDYSKPLEVITLCTPCHVLVHHRSLAL